MARKIIQNAIDQDASVAFFEAQESGVPNLLGMAFSLLFLFLLTPVIKPFSLGRFFFTYLCPVVPLFVLWDGIVSCLRTYSEKEMWELVRSIHNHQTYDWKIGRLRKGPGVVLYLIGTKKAISGQGK